MRYLIAGASGQLATEFRRRFERDGTPHLVPEESRLDIADRRQVEEALGAFRPEVVLNCAADNRVDRAESDPDDAFRVNAEAVGMLAEACRARRVVLVHYSTDYVFDGCSTVPYLETSATGPLNRYGQSKLDGERLLLASGCDHLLLRVSWVYGPGPGNFLRRLLAWADGRDAVRAVTDQVSVPTWTGDIVDWTLAALDRGLRGLYHGVGAGYASRYEVAVRLFELLGRRVRVEPAVSADFPSPARRPAFSAMDGSRLGAELGLKRPVWDESLARWAEGQR